MKIDNTVLVGGGAGLVGLLLGLAIGTAGRSELEARASRQDEIGSGVAALSDAVGAIDARASRRSTRASAGWRARSPGPARRSRARSRRWRSGSKASARRSAARSRTWARGCPRRSRAISEGLRAQVAAAAEPARWRGSSESGASDHAAAAAGRASRCEIAHTVSFGDGAARVFLSAADRVRGTARVAVNGSEMSTLTLGAAGDASGTAA